MNNKQLLFKRIREELSGELDPVRMVYYWGKYRIYKDGAMMVVPDKEAIQLLSGGAILTACLIDDRKGEVHDLPEPNEDGLRSEVRRVGTEPIPVPVKVINRAVRDSKRGGFGYMTVSHEPVITNLFFIEIM